MDLVDIYRKEYIKRFCSWDENHEYGHNSLFQNVFTWRKANHIHNWFVENVQNGVDDCRAYEVSEENLIALCEVCRTVLDSSVLIPGKVINGYTIRGEKEVPIYEDGVYIKDPSVAKELLPTCSGFFFGSQEYDQWYYGNVLETYEVLKELLEETDFDNEMIIYQSSW